LNRTLSDASGNPTLKQQRRQDEWCRLLRWLGNSNQLTELTYNAAGDLTDAKRTTQARRAEKNQKAAVISLQIIL